MRVTTGKMTSKDSLTAHDLPGRFTISVSPRVPLTPRYSIPLGVCFMDSARMASTMPGS